MTVSELISELEKMPKNKPVHVLLESVTISDEFGDYPTEYLTQYDAQKSSGVRDCGNAIIIHSGEFPW